MAGETCSVFDCDHTVTANGMCLKHYKRARTASRPAPTFSLLNFSENLDHDGPIPPHRPDLGQCWEWRGARNGQGYGVMPGPRFGTRLAHRAALTLHLGRALEGVTLHLCDNPSCSRPSHLREGTQAENVADAAAKGRSRGGRYAQTRCIRGHELTDENVRLIKRSDGYSERKCMACSRENNKKQAARRKAARHERGLLRRKAA